MPEERELELALRQSVQERTEKRDEGEPFAGALMLRFAKPDDEISPWWTPARDVELRQFWKREGLLASTIYNLQAIAAGTGFVFEGDSDAIEKARVPIDGADFGAGFKVLTKKVAEDWFTQDNGIFVELIGPGSASSTLHQPIGIAHLDAGRCWRSGDPEHPVWYYNPKENKWYKMHWTRVAFAAANPSPIEMARGVGFCAVSRVQAMTIVLRDTIRYKQEKIGGQQTRAIIYGSGVPSGALELAVEEAYRKASNAGQYKVSSLPIVAQPHVETPISLGVLELAGLPDGFDWNTELTSYMYILALAFGVDARELWPATASGATRADAEVQHRKAMRKGIGDLMTTLEHIINYRVMPPDVTFAFKPKDSEEDSIQASIENTRAATAKAMLESEAITPRGATVYLVNSGVLPTEYLENQELAPQPVLPGESEPTSEDETDEGEAPPDEEPEMEDELEAGKQATEPVIVDPERFGQIADVNSLPTSAVTRSAIRRELELWRRHPLLAPYVVEPNDVGAYNQLPEDGEEEKSRRGWWRFFRRKQLQIPEDSRRALYEARLAAFYDNVGRLAAQLVGGEITLAEWEAAMRDEIKAMHTAAAAIAHGGWDQMTFSDWGRVGAEVRKQYEYLHRWAQTLAAEVAQGIPLSEAQIAARANMYGNSSRATYSRISQVAIGIDPSVLPAHPGDGTTACYTNCQCRWDPVEVDARRGDWDYYWRLGVAEHCATCEARTAAWNPYRVRRGEGESTILSGALFR